MSDYQGDLPEEYEHIPWSQLVPVQKDRSLQLAVIVVVVIAALLAIVFLLRRPSPITPVVAATAPPVATTGPLEAAGFEPESVAADAPVPLSIPQPEAPQIYSEADLMAALPPTPELMAIARAEWFVTDYFTVDGDAELADAVSGALPDVVDLPAAEGTTISYVEWARSVEVDTDGAGGFDVTVWFRTLYGDRDGGFVRAPVRAVMVSLVTDTAGRLAVADIPMPVPLVPMGIPPSWPAPDDPPAEVVAQSMETAAVLGENPTLVSAGRDEDGWRVVLSVGDASGLRFPIVVRPGAG